MREMWRTPAGRGFIMLAVMSAAFGFAMNAQLNIVTNYFNDVLHLTGPQFGYITAIREIGGFVLIFLTALFYKVSLQRLTAGALVILGAGYALFSLSHDFWSVVPWVVITSFGMHTVMQTQTYLGMSLTTIPKSGAVLGRLGAVSQIGTFAALIMILVTFRLNWLSFRPTFIILGIVAVIGALAIVGFPHLHEGQPRKVPPKREPIVFRRVYHYYYWLCLLDGARQQVFFSFGLWVLVDRFKLDVSEVSMMMLGVTFLCMVSASWLGRMIDRHGERKSLSLVSLAYVVALGGYALANHVAVACFFYLVYSVIAPVSYIGASTYLRKIAAPEDVSPSLAMGVTLSHATSVIVPIFAGYILNFVGYQVPFFLACGIAVLALAVTLRLDPVKQRCPARIALDEKAAAAVATCEE